MNDIEIRNQIKVVEKELDTLMNMVGQTVLDQPSQEDRARLFAFAYNLVNTANSFWEAKADFTGDNTIPEDAEDYEEEN